MQTCILGHLYTLSATCFRLQCIDVPDQLCAPLHRRGAYQLIGIVILLTSSVFHPQALAASLSCRL